MVQPSVRNLLGRMRRKKRADDQSATQPAVLTISPASSSVPPIPSSTSTTPIARVSNQGQGLVLLPGLPSLSTQEVIDPEVLPTSTSNCQPFTDPSRIVQTQQGREVRAAPGLPKPYANNAGLWKEALAQLNELVKHNIGNLIGDIDLGATNVKSLAAIVQDQVGVAFKAQQKNSKSGRLVESSLAVLGRFLSAVDVAVSFDPVHAALPWAVVRSVLVIVTSNVDLKNQLIAGIAVVASLLAHCDVYQQLYMAPGPALRPSEESLSILKTAIVQTYAKAQLFLSFAVEQQHNRLRLATATFRVGDANNHVNELSRHEKELVRASDICERHCNLSNRSAVQELLSLKADISKVFQEQISQIELLEWISRIPYGKHHSRVKEARTSDTSGTGKTFLTSKVIDHRCNALESSPTQEGFAFFYCDRNEEERRQPLSILQSYVRQLSTTVKSPNYIRKQLQDCCQKARANGSDLGFEACKEQLLESIYLYSQTTLVLDALDECEPKSRGQVVEVVEYLISRSGNGLKVFISSRPDRDIRDRFSKTPNIEIQATDNEEDIQEFVREKIVQHGNWQGMSQNLQDDIIQTLFTRSQGMFQWAFLQINELLNLETESAIRSRLGSLPADLKIAYDEIYKNIIARDRHDKALADRAFKWVACSFWPLTSETLIPAIRLDSDTTALALSNPITESQLLHLCNNLLVIDSQRGVWRFSHLSVREYFEANHWDLRTAHCHAASVSLKSLLIAYANANLDEIDVTPRNAPFTLEGYSKHLWLYHVHNQETRGSGSLLAQLLKSFLGSPTESSLQYRAWVKAAGCVLYNYGIHECINTKDVEPATTALFGMCRFSLHQILLDWWEHAELDIRAINSRGDNLLSLAAVSRCTQICENLIRRGIPVNMQLQHASYGSALAAAAQAGNCELVELLIAEGADVNMELQHEKYGSALVTASAGASEHNYEAIKLLVAEGADVNMQVQHGDYGSALAAAAAVQNPIVDYYVNGKVIGLLIAQGADVNMQLQNGYYGSALAAAVSNEFNEGIEKVKVLLASGADVNMQLQSGAFGSALIHAVASWPASPQIVEYLLNNTKVKVNQQVRHGRFGTALAAAAFYRREKYVEILIKAGANIHLWIQHGEFRTAAQAACAGARPWRCRPTDWDHASKQGQRLWRLLQRMRRRQRRRRIVQRIWRR
ncbi:hypothetical protein F5Y01DRAFT_318385 [Xylaria sp. FL0043]|nr:hypothetical protein F5Y01DRAFT_318385 [Xylaria sp. FL0043]